MGEFPGKNKHSTHCARSSEALPTAACVSCSIGLENSTGHTFPHYTCGASNTSLPQTFIPENISTLLPSSGRANKESEVRDT